MKKPSRKKEAIASATTIVRGEDALFARVVNIIEAARGHDSPHA